MPPSIPSWPVGLRRRHVPKWRFRARAKQLCNEYPRLLFQLKQAGRSRFIDLHFGVVLPVHSPRTLRARARSFFFGACRRRATRGLRRHRRKGIAVSETTRQDAVGMPPSLFIYHPKNRSVVFDMADRDRDGALDWEQLFAFVHAADPHASERVLKRLARHLDPFHSGRIEWVPFEVPSHVYRHVCRHVCRHVYIPERRHLYRHVLRIE